MSPPDLFQFRQPPPLAPPGASCLLAAILLAIDLARSAEALALWWRDHQPALRRLSTAELAVAIAAKDRAKASRAA